jgi:hypothetical protein
VSFGGFGGLFESEDHAQQRWPPADLHLGRVVVGTLRTFLLACRDCYAHHFTPCQDHGEGIEMREVSLTQVSLSLFSNIGTGSEPG